MDPLNKCQICTLVYRKSFQPFIEGQSQDRTNIMGFPLKSQLAFSPFKVILREWERGGRSHKLHWFWFNIWNTNHKKTCNYRRHYMFTLIIAFYPNCWILYRSLQNPDQRVLCESCLHLIHIVLSYVDHWCQCIVSRLLHRIQIFVSDLYRYIVLG